MSLELVEIKIPNRFHPLTRGKKAIFTKPGKIGEIIEDIIKEYPNLAEKTLNDKKELKAGIILFLNEESKKRFITKDEEILAGQKITLIIASSGG